MPTNNYSDNLSDAQAPLDDEKLWELLSLYVDGEADPAQAAIVEQMLSSDPAYRRDFDFLMETSTAMHMVEEIAPPAGLRDLVYARTVNRPTLVGRLRAAWSRATAPGFTRYASIGGALAVAALGAVVLWPSLHSTSAGGTTPPQIAAVTPPHTETSGTAETAPRRIADIKNLERIIPPVRQVKTPPPPEKIAHNGDMKSKRAEVSTVSTVGESSALKVAREIHPLKNHPLPTKGNGSHSDRVQVAEVKGYPYDKKMDEGKAIGRQGTIFTPTGNDLGPMVAANDDASARTTPTTDAMPQDTTVQPTAPAPKPTMRVATLPPQASQNIAAAVLRRNNTARYSGYDHNVAESIQRHEIMVDLVKGSF
jgi:hypothetical protein